MSHKKFLPFYNDNRFNLILFAAIILFKNGSIQLRFYKPFHFPEARAILFISYSGIVLAKH
ncbi:MAG: hypothetical protein ACXWWC_01405 [Chitinophagaceae bacterium]